MTIPFNFLRSVTGPQLQVSGVDKPRYPILNLTGGFTLTDEPTIPRYTLSIGDISENATIVDLYNKAGKPRVAVNKSVPLNGICSFSGSGVVPAWTADTTLGAPKQNGTDSSRFYFVDLNLPNNITLTSLTASITPAATHTGLPSVMPGISLYYQSGSTRTLISAMSSSAPTFADYNSPHVISMSLSGTVVNTNYQYSLQLKGEGNTNSVSGLLFNMVNMNWTAPTGSYNS